METTAPVISMPDREGPFIITRRGHRNGTTHHDAAVTAFRFILGRLKETPRREFLRELLRTLSNKALQLLLQEGELSEKLRGVLTVRTGMRLLGEPKHDYRITIEDAAVTHGILLRCLRLEQLRRQGAIEVQFPPDPLHPYARFKIRVGIGRLWHTLNLMQLIELLPEEQLPEHWDVSEGRLLRATGKAPPLMRPLPGTWNWSPDKARRIDAHSEIAAHLLIFELHKGAREDFFRGMINRLSDKAIRLAFSQGEHGSILLWRMTLGLKTRLQGDPDHQHAVDATDDEWAETMALLLRCLLLEQRRRKGEIEVQFPTDPFAPGALFKIRTAPGRPRYALTARQVLNRIPL